MTKFFIVRLAWADPLDMTHELNILIEAIANECPFFCEIAICGQSQDENELTITLSLKQVE